MSTVSSCAEKLGALVELIKSDHPLFTKGFVHEPREQNLSGITDKYEHYFFLQVDEFETNYERLDSMHYEATQQVKLIASSTKPTSDLLAALIGTITRLNYPLVSTNDDGETIHLEETEQALKKKLNLVRIIFQFRYIVPESQLAECDVRLC